MNIEELYDLLLSDKPSANLKNNENKLFELIPELKICKGFNQNSDWHVYDVYEHIMHVIDYVPSNIILRLSALFHDIGKPFSYTEDENKIGHFYGHWEKSQKIFEEFSNKYNIDKDIKGRVSNLIYYHDINISKLGEDKLNDIFQIFKVDGINQLYELKKADLLAQNKKYHYILDDYDKQKEEILSRINICLTSYGLDTRFSDYMDSYDDIINLLKNKKVLIIPNAKLLNEDRTNSSIIKNELKKNNIESVIIDIDTDSININDYDALYLSGGEPKNLMDSIYNANLFDEINDFINSGGIIIGQSAGAMIFCKKYFDTTTGSLLIRDNGYDYINKMIVPHYDNLPSDIKSQIPDDTLKLNDNDHLYKLF